MRSKETSFTWSVVDDEIRWQQSQSISSGIETTKSVAIQQSAHKTDLHLATMAVVLFLLWMGGWYWQKQALEAKTLDELQSALRQEVQTYTLNADGTNIEHGLQRKTHTNDSTTSTGDAALTLAQTAQVNHYRQIEERIMGQVVVSYREDGGMRPYRETRFYQKVGGKWQPIAPDPSLLGAPQSYATAHFSIHYRAVDADAVYGMAPKLEQLYAKLLADFGLTVPPTHSLYKIDVATDELLGVDEISFSEQSIRVSSPTLLSVPAEVSPATVLYQSLIYPLTGLLVHEIPVPHSWQWKQNYQIPSWAMVLQSLRLWALWEDGGDLAVGHEAVVKLLLDRRNSVAMPYEYAHFCRAYSSWGLSPWDLSIPLACHAIDNEHQSQHYSTLPMWLQQQLDSNESSNQLERAFAGTVGLETIIEYVVAAYGREQLPRFIRAIGEHSSLDTLIPAAFGVSTSEFETGWREYLEDRYDIGQNTDDTCQPSRCQ